VAVGAVQQTDRLEIEIKMGIKELTGRREIKSTEK
jgi:hypothetical protein